MFAVLLWDRYPTWPSSVVGSIVNSREEAVEMAEAESVRALARGKTPRFTVHVIEWPPLHDTTTSGREHRPAIGQQREGGSEQGE